MKVEIKSMFLGIALGGIGVFSILFLIGNVETEFSLSTGDNNQNKNIALISKKIRDEFKKVFFL